MLRSLNSRIGDRIIATDGVAGKALDFMINCEGWQVGELVASVGPRWRSRQVRIPRPSMRRPVGSTDMLPVSLTIKQTRACPPADDYQIRSQAIRNELISAGTLDADPVAPRPIAWESMIGYCAQALDGQAGFLRDLIVNDENWRIQYFVVELALEGAAHQTLVASGWISGVYEDQSSVSVNLSIRELLGSPEYDPQVPVNRDVEGKLYNYYGQPFKSL